jgi:UDP-glucose 4-epimerase
MKILVTGSSGFIGKHLIQVIPNCITPDRNNIIESIIENRPDVIFHLAANPLIKTNDINSLYDSNVGITHKILEHCPKDCHIIFSSSAAVYGDLGLNSIADESSPTIPTSLYGETKLISERLINMYSLSGKVRATILRLVANVGPNPTHGVIKDLLFKYKNNDKLELLGDYPGSYKPYMHVKDTVRAMAYVMYNNLYGVYNLSTTQILSVKDIANLIEDYFKLNKEQVWLGKSSNWKGDNPIVKINSDKFNSTEFIKLYNTSKEAVNAAIKGF